MWNLTGYAWRGACAASGPCVRRPNDPIGPRADERMFPPITKLVQPRVWRDELAANLEAAAARYRSGEPPPS